MESLLPMVAEVVLLLVWCQQREQGPGVGLPGDTQGGQIGMALARWVVLLPASDKPNHVMVAGDQAVPGGGRILNNASRSSFGCVVEVLDQVWITGH
jgi:hypothetical protein